MRWADTGVLFLVEPVLQRRWLFLLRFLLPSSELVFFGLRLVCWEECARGVSGCALLRTACARDWLGWFHARVGRGGQAEDGMEKEVLTFSFEQLQLLDAMIPGLDLRLMFPSSFFPS